MSKLQETGARCGAYPVMLQKVRGRSQWCGQVGEACRQRHDLWGTEAFQHSKASCRTGSPASPSQDSEQPEQVSSHPGRVQQEKPAPLLLSPVMSTEGPGAEALQELLHQNYEESLFFLFCRCALSLGELSGSSRTPIC